MNDNEADPRMSDDEFEAVRARFHKAMERANDHLDAVLSATLRHSPDTRSRYEHDA